MGSLNRAIHATHYLHPVREPEDAGGLRRELGGCAQERGVRPALAAKAELAATEIATNILGHAGGRGYVLFRGIGEGQSAGIEMIGVDRGPGIEDVARALADRTPADYERMLHADGRPQGIGAGLSAVRRLASEFDIFSRPGEGTVVLARFHGGATPLDGGYQVGGVSVALEGFGIQSGDGWATATDGSACTAVLVDGLGHGPIAKAAADAALDVFAREYQGDCEKYILLAHEALRATRGGVLGLCRIDRHAMTTHFVGIGNIEGRILLRDRAHGLASRNGTLGIDMTAPVMRLLEYAWEPGAVAILHSDGVSARFDSESLRALVMHDPAIIAATIHRDHSRGRDDASVVVVKDVGEPLA